MNNLLLIEDDANLGASLESYLKMEGFQVHWAHNLAQARSIDLSKIQIIILDWMLPDGQGIDFLKEIKKAKNNTPVLMLTARNELIDKVIGLESGAYDYITKPFEARELLARIRVHLRATQNLEERKPIIRRAHIEIDTENRIVKNKGQEVQMTKMEYELLLLLAEKPGRPYSREEILNKVWGFENYPSTRTVDTHVLQLRHKFGEDTIETVRGIGYKLNKNLES